MIRDLILKNRSYRRFYEEKSVSMEVLSVLVDHARLSSSARNRQPLKYVLCNEPETNTKIFETLSWARNLGEDGTPVAGERPAAYVVLLGDCSLAENFFCDDGIAATNLLLTAVEMGLGGCILVSIDRKRLSESLSLAENLTPLMVVALGHPKETVVLEDIPESGDSSYYRTEDRVHHVPKRALKDIIVKKYGG